MSQREDPVIHDSFVSPKLEQLIADNPASAQAVGVGEVGSGVRPFFGLSTEAEAQTLVGEYISGLVRSNVDPNRAVIIRNGIWDFIRQARTRQGQ